MKPKSIMLLFLALGCGLVAAIGVTQVIAEPEGKGDGSDAKEQTVFVAIEQIPYGRQLTPLALRIEHWPLNRVPAHALTSIEDIEGRYAKTTLFPGEPILDSKLLPKGADPPGASILIPKGMRVIGVKVDKVIAGSLIQPGDFVDLVVFLAKNPSKGIANNAAVTFLRNIKVFAVDDDYKTDLGDDPEEGGSSKTSSSQTVRLLVTPSDAEMVMMASELGSIRLVMRGPGGEDDSEDVSGIDQPTTLDKLLQGTLSANKEEPKDDRQTAGMDEFNDRLTQMVPVIQQPATFGGVTEPEDSHSMVIYYGDRVNHVKMTKTSTSDTNGGSEWFVEGLDMDDDAEPNKPGKAAGAAGAGATDAPGQGGPATGSPIPIPDAKTIEALSKILGGAMGTGGKDE